MKELDQGWSLDSLPSAQGELSGALGQLFGSRDGKGGEGLKLNVPHLVMHQMCKEGCLRCWWG